MTDDELRRSLAKRLGWTVEEDKESRLWTAVNPVLKRTHGYKTGISEDHAWRVSIPSLSELVATGEARLTEEQLERYGEAVACVVWKIDRLSAYVNSSQLWMPITAPAAVRARALLETLPK